jgi:hypothetical protein
MRNPVRATIIASTVPLFAATLVLHAAHAADPHFSDFRSPSLSGLRQVSALLDFKGIPENRMTVFVVYSNSRDEVVKRMTAHLRDEAQVFQFAAQRVTPGRVSTNAVKAFSQKKLKEKR